MTIIDFFDPYNMEHIKVYKEEVAYGFYPTGFFPEDIEYVIDWQKIMMCKMANAWAEQVLADNVISMPSVVDSLVDLREYMLQKEETNNKACGKKR